MATTAATACSAILGFDAGSPRKGKSLRRASSASVAAAATSAPSSKRRIACSTVRIASRPRAICQARRWRRARRPALKSRASESGATRPRPIPYAASGAKLASSGWRWVGSIAFRTPSSPTAATSQESTSGERGRSLERGRARSAPPAPARARARKTTCSLAAAVNAVSAEIWRTIRIETPSTKYVQPPTPIASSSAALSRSTRAQRAIAPSRAAAGAQTARKRSSGTLACPESSSRGSAACTTGPGSETRGRSRYSQPVAASRTASPARTASALRATLTMEAAGRGEIGGHGLLAPERPVVPAARLEVAVRDVEPGQLAGEGPVLQAELVAAAGVDPEVRAAGSQLGRNPRQHGHRVVLRQQLQAGAEDRADRVGALVPRPALDDAELVRAVEGDVDRAVPALGEARDCARRRLGNRPEAVVDRPHEVPPDEGRPAVARRDAVRPLLVGELSGGAVGHDEDQRLGLVPRDEVVLDHAHPHRVEEGPRPAGEAVQEVENRIALGARVVARRQIDDDLLAASAQGGAADEDRLLAARLGDVGGVLRRREAAVDTVVVRVALDAQTADREEADERPHRQSGCQPARPHQVRKMARHLARKHGYAA